MHEGRIRSASLIAGAAGSPRSPRLGGSASQQSFGSGRRSPKLAVLHKSPQPPGGTNDHNTAGRRLNRGEVVTIGNIALQRVEDDGLRVTFGSRSYVVDETVFEILVGNAVSEHRHAMDDHPHERWCDRRLHARSDAETIGGHPGVWVGTG